MRYGICVSDLHFGHPRLNSDTKYIETIEKILRDEREASFLVVCGDLFDRKISIGDIGMEHLARMVDCLRDMENCKIRFLYGTQSHECNQYTNLLKLIDRSLDVLVWTHVGNEDLWDDLKVCFIPEEFTNLSYPSFFFKQIHEKSHLVFYHGEIDGILSKIYAPDLRETSDIEYPRVISLKSEFLSSLGDYVYAGHYHRAHVVRDNVKYAGSLWRWANGEEEPKGYYRLWWDGKSCADEFVVVDAPIYETIVVTDRESLDLAKSKLADSTNSSSNLTIKIQFSDISDLETIKAEIGVLPQSVKIAPKYVLMGNDDSIGEDGWTIDDRLSPNQKIVEFIRRKYKYEMTIERLGRYI